MALAAIAAALLGRDFMGAQARNPVRVPCELVHEMFYVRASVNGSAPLWLNLDTGASHSVVDPTVAKTLHLQEGGGGDASGIGRGQGTRFGRVSGATIQIADAVLPNQMLLTLSMNYLASSIGHVTDGSLGSNIFANYVVRTDYLRRKVSFFDPSSFEPPRTALSMPLTLRDNMPYIDAAIKLPDGTSARGTFLIDSGMIGAAVSINDWFLNEHPELSSIRSLEMPPVQVVGGTFRYRLCRLQSLSIGQYTLDEPIAVLPDLASGVDTDRTIIGTIGADALSRFTDTFDYTGRRLFLTANKQVHLPFETDMSGLKLTTEPPLFDRFLVDGVTSGSPADQAGIRDGDVIAAIDGHPASGLTLERIQYEFQQLNGVHHLIVERSGKQLRVDLKLRRLV